MAWKKGELKPLLRYSLLLKFGPNHSEKISLSVDVLNFQTFWGCRAREGNVEVLVVVSALRQVTAADEVRVIAHSLSICSDWIGESLR